MLSIPHLIIIFVIVLIAVGPEKMPQLARTLGKAMSEFRKITGDLRRVVDDEMRELDRQTRETEIRKRDAAAQAALPGASSPAVPVLTGASVGENSIAPPLPDEHVIAPPSSEPHPYANLEPPAAPSTAPPGTIASEAPNRHAREAVDAESAPAATPAAASPVDDHEPTSDAQSKPA